MSTTNGGWRNPAAAGTSVVITTRKVTVDAEGFVKEDLSAEEIDKLSKMKQWSYLDRDGAEIQGLRLEALLDVKARLVGEVANAQGVLDDRVSRLAECNARIAEIESKTAALSTAKPTKPIALGDLTFEELRALCDQHKVIVSPSERSQKKLIAALRPILTPKETVDADPQ